MKSKYQFQPKFRLVIDSYLEFRRWRYSWEHVLSDTLRSLCHWRVSKPECVTRKLKEKLTPKIGEFFAFNLLVVIFTFMVSILHQFKFERKDDTMINLPSMVDILFRNITELRKNLDLYHCIQLGFFFLGSFSKWYFNKPQILLNRENTETAARIRCAEINCWHWLVKKR